ncbi:hypothetical protein H5U35_03795 [Candidatus Aerophobetes bacterium]|nr:hypothetical protein [Candidatus Aerophobetes bacterium]
MTKKEGGGDKGGGIPAEIEIQAPKKSILSFSLSDSHPGRHSFLSFLRKQESRI